MGPSRNVFLLVHDNPVEAADFQQCLFHITPNPVLYHTDQNNEILPFVRRHLPDIIFMNTGVGGVSSVPSLIRLKSDSDLGKIPVVIYSMPKSTDELKEWYNLGAARYFEQPVNSRGIIFGLEIILYLAQKHQLIRPEFDQFLITTNYQHFDFRNKSVISK